MPTVYAGPLNFGSMWPRRVRTSRSGRLREVTKMALGYDGKLYILAFDHRGSFQKKMFGIEGDPTPEETDRISDAKKLIFEGMELAVKRGVDAEATGVLVDEQFGSDIPQLAREHGLKLAMPVEKSGQDEFDFQYGADFGEHIAKFDPHFAKVLVRYNPELRPELMRRAIEELQDAGVEVDVWKIEGVDAREDAEMLAEQTRKGS